MTLIQLIPSIWSFWCLNESSTSNKPTAGCSYSPTSKSYFVFLLQSSVLANGLQSAHLLFQLLSLFRCIPWPSNFCIMWDHNHCQHKLQIPNFRARYSTLCSDSPFCWLIQLILVPSVTPKQSSSRAVVSSSFVNFDFTFRLCFTLYNSFVCARVHWIQYLTSFCFLVATVPKYLQNTSKYARTVWRLTAIQL